MTGTRLKRPQLLAHTTVGAISDHNKYLRKTEKTMQLSPETFRGASFLKDIFERGKFLTLSEPKRLMGGNSYAFIVTADNKETDFCLSREQVDDTPGTPEYPKAADELARAFEGRFKNVDPNLFVTASGRVLHISPEWPAMPLLNADGNGYIAANGTRVPVKDVLSNELAICLVKMTHSQTFPAPGRTPFQRLAGFVNSIRADVDEGKITFYPSFEEHPKIMQNVDFRFGAMTPQPSSLSRYLQHKVWLLGFRSGQKNTRVWIADPWDAAYLSSTVSLLRQEAAILDAQGLITLDDGEEFASTGKVLLAQQGPVVSASPSSTPQPPQPDNAEFDVFVSHSTVDKPYVEPLVVALKAAGISVWFDKSAMEWGDSLRSEIDRGLSACRYGIVVFSKAFLNKKKWTEHEVNALFAKEEPGKKVILPIWHGITRDELLQYSPAFADRLAKNPATDSYADIVASLLQMLGRVAPEPAPLQSPAPPTHTRAKANAIVHARYDAKGKATPWLHAYIRPVAESPGQFTFETSEGDLQQGDQEEIALCFIKYDRALKAKGYTRMEFGNLSGNRAFDI